MVIVHLANINNNKYNGVNVVVPQYINNQSQYADAFLINLNDVKLDSLNNEKYKSITIGDSIEHLPFPYNNPDLIVIHGIYDLKILLYYLRYIKNKQKYIVIPHGGLTKESQKKSFIKKSVVNLMFYNGYFENANAIQFLSKEEERKSIKKNNNKIIAGNGINLNRANQYHVKENDEFIFIYIGRLEIKHKGLDLMVEAINKDKKFINENNIKFYLYGIDYENSYSKLMSFVKKNNLENYIFIDKNGIFGEEKVSKLLEADFYIQTSRLEGLSLGVLEVLSLGIPSLLADGVGMNNIYNTYNCGIVCENTVDSVAKKIIDCYNLSIEERRIISSNAFKTAKLFGWDEVTKKTVRLYEEVANANKIK